MSKNGLKSNNLDIDLLLCKIVFERYVFIIYHNIKPRIFVCRFLLSGQSSMHTLRGIIKHLLVKKIYIIELRKYNVTIIMIMYYR